MRWFLNPYWALLGLLMVPLVLLYLLRQKRPNQRVSSTLLWSKALADLRASQPFQRFRRSLLLLIQLVALATLVLALMRPVLQGQARQATAGVLVLSAGASMQVCDHNGPSRLELAKIQAHRLVDGLRPGDQLMLLADSGVAGRLSAGDAGVVGDGGGGGRSGFTGNKAELHKLIDQIQAADTVPDLSESLLLAATSLRAFAPPPPPGGAGASPADKDKLQIVTDTEKTLLAGNIWLISDGVGVNVPNVPELRSRLRYVRVGESSNNVGIVRVGVTPNPTRDNPSRDRQGATPMPPDTHNSAGGGYEVFVGLLNASPQPREVFVGLKVPQSGNIPGRLLTSIRVVLPAAGTQGITFENVHPPAEAAGGAAGGILQVTLDAKGDDFALDDNAYVILPPPRRIRVVLVTHGNRLLEDYLKTVSKLGEVEGVVAEPGRDISGLAPDLAIFDGIAPPAANWPACDTLVIHPGGAKAEEADGFVVQGQLERPTILRWQRDDPLLNFVELGDLRIARAAKVVSDGELRELIASPQGPLLACRTLGGMQRYFLAFNPLTESNWWMQPSLLVFLENLVRQSGERRFINAGQMLTTGQVARLWLPPHDTASSGRWHMLTPDGRSVTLAPGVGDGSGGGGGGADYAAPGGEALLEYMPVGPGDVLPDLVGGEAEHGRHEGGHAGRQAVADCTAGAPARARQAIAVEAVLDDLEVA
ncbi:MAG: BatA domain-containing protein, partial [Phycisphaerae bacterium]